MDRNLFELTHIEQTERPVRWAVRFAFIVLDAILYSIGLYLCLEAALLRVENVTTMTHLVSVVILFTGYLFLSRGIYVNLFRAPMFFGLALEFTAVFSIVVGLAWLSLRVPSGFDFAWFPWWFHRLPDMLLLFLRLSPLLAAWLILGFIVLSSQLGRRRPVFPLAVIALLAALVLLQYSLIMGRGFRVWEFLGILFIFAVPFQAALRGRPRLFARTLFLCFTAAFIIWHFLGLTPISHESPFADLPGVTLQYPAPGKEAPLAPPLITDIEPCPAGGLLYVAGGRSGKLLGIDTGDGAITENVLRGSDFTKVAADPWNHNIYVIDASAGEVLQFAPGSLHAVAKKKIATDWGFAPKDIIPFDKVAYISYSEYPGVAEFSTEEFTQESGIRAQELPVEFNTGAWAMAAAPEMQTLYIVSGAPVAGPASAITAIDPIEFQTGPSGILPDSGPALVNAPDRPVMYSTSFFRDNIYEINQESLQVTRTLPGPSAARSIAYDEKRKYLYAAGYYDGRLAVIDTVGGRAASSHFACNRIVSVKLDKRTDRLWLACIKGIYRIELPVFLGEIPPEPAAPEKD